MTISDNIFCVYFGLFAKNSNKMTKHKQAEREIVHGTVSVFPAYVSLVCLREKK